MRPNLSVEAVRLAAVFLATALASGAAAGAEAGKGKLIEIQAVGEKARAYLALPASGAARGGVVVVHEWWGLNEQIQGVADRLAAAGFVAIAPDLYRGVVAADPEKAHELMRGLQEGRASSILRAAASHLKAQEELAGRKVGIVGFCMGGRLSLVTALDGKELSGAVIFYGAPVLEKERLAALSAPVLGLFGADDKGIPVADVKAFEATAKAAGKKVETHLYAGAGHAFFNESRPSFNKEAAEDAWKRTLAFFDSALTK